MNNQGLSPEDSRELIEENDKLERITDDLITQIKDCSDLKILLFEELANAEGIKDSLSFDSKLIKLRAITKELRVKILVSDYMGAEAKLSQLKYRRDQVWERINSLKKIYGFTPQ